MTEILSDTPKLPKWPFLALDALLLATAALIALQAGSPLDGVALCCVVGCVVLATFVCMLPFLVDYAREQERVMDERRRVLEGMTKSLVASSEQVEQAVKGVANLSDQVRISLGQMEVLPGRLKEELGRVEAGIQTVRNEEVERLQQLLAKEREAATSRIDVATENVAKAMLELARIEGLTQDFEKRFGEMLRDLQDQTQAGASQLGSLVSGTLESLGREAAKRAEDNARQQEASTRARAEALERSLLESEARVAEFVEASRKPFASYAGEAEARLQASQAALQSSLERVAAQAESHLSAASQATEQGLKAAAAEAETHFAERIEQTLAAAESRLLSVEGRLATLLTQLEEAGERLKAQSVPAPAPATAPAPVPSVPAVTPASLVQSTQPPSSVTPLATPLVAGVQTAPEVGLMSASIRSLEGAAASVAQPVEELPVVTKPEAEAPASQAEVEAEAAEDEDDQVEPEAVPAQSSMEVELAPPPAPEPDELPEEAPVAAPLLDLFSTDYDFEKAMTSQEAQPVSVSLSTDGMTRLLVTSYVGQGNKVFIRGEGQTSGQPLEFLAVGKWRWQSAQLSETLRVRIFKNDRIECPGLGDILIEPGHQTEVTAKF